MTKSVNRAPFQPVSRGEPLAIHYEEYNAFLAAVRAVKDLTRYGAGDGIRPNRQADIILVKNDSGTDRDRFDVLGLDVPLIDHATDADEFGQRVACSGLTPATPDHTGQYCVLQEPIAEGEIGRAVVAGVTPVQVYVNGADDAFCEIENSTATYLKSGAAGSAQILWKESGTTQKWAIVRIGNHAPDAIRLGKAVADISPGDSGTIDLWAKSGMTEAATGDSVTARDWLETGITAGQKCLVLTSGADVYFLRVPAGGAGGIATNTASVVVTTTPTDLVDTWTGSSSVTISGGVLTFADGGTFQIILTFTWEKPHWTPGTIFGPLLDTLAMVNISGTGNDSDLNTNFQALARFVPFSLRLTSTVGGLDADHTGLFTSANVSASGPRYQAVLAGVVTLGPGDTLEPQATLVAVVDGLVTGVDVTAANVVLSVAAIGP